MTEQRQLQLKAAQKHPLNQEASRLLSLAGEVELDWTLPILQLAFLVAWQGKPETNYDSPQALMLANLEAQRTPQQIMESLEAMIQEHGEMQDNDKMGLPPNAQEAGEMILRLLQPAAIPADLR